MTRLTVMVPDGTYMDSLRPVLSPDGRMLAFMAAVDGPTINFFFHIRLPPK